MIDTLGMVEFKVKLSSIFRASSSAVRRLPIIVLLISAGISSGVFYR